MAFIVLLLFAYLFGLFLGLVVPLILHLTVYATMFLALVVWTALKVTGKALLWVVVGTGKLILWMVVGAGEDLMWVVTRSGRGIHFAALLLYFLIDEKLRGAQDDQSDEAQEDDYGHSFDDEADEAAAQSDLEAAYMLFGLALIFTREELQRAYKKAIRKAHPDLGGSVEAAQELNVARDLIMSAQGWA